MAIIIQNISEHPGPMGPHRYQLRINQKVICEFEHNRENGLAVCLRKGADAVIYKLHKPLLRSIKTNLFLSQSYTMASHGMPTLNIRQCRHLKVFRHDHLIVLFL